MTSNVLKCSKIVFLSAGLYLIFVQLFSRNISDNDLWGYLSFGRIFWEYGYFPYYDIFSYTPTKPLWIYHEWLTGVIFYFIYEHSGSAGLQLLRYIVIILTIYLMYLSAIKKGGDSIFALIAILPAMLLISFGYLPVRAQIFTYLFFILTIYILETARKDQKWQILCWLIPLEILWCNLHGGFVAGLGLIFIYSLGEGLSKRGFVPFIVILLLATLTTLINPYGFEYWKYTIDAISMPRLDINEWMSVFMALKSQYQVVPVIIFIGMFFLYAFFCILHRQWNITDILIVIMISYLGFKHVRHSIFFGLIFGAYLPVILSELWSLWKAKQLFFTSWRYTPQVLLVGIFLLLYFSINPSLSMILRPSFSIVTPSSHFPIGAINWIKTNNIQGNILPNFDWGEFIIWTCYPSCRVAMDGRYETVYKEEVHKEYFDFLIGRNNWRKFLTEYPHDMVLIKTNSRTYWLMLKEPLWQITYMDPGCVLFRKKPISHGDNK